MKISSKGHSVENKFSAASPSLTRRGDMWCAAPLWNLLLQSIELFQIVQCSADWSRKILYNNWCLRPRRWQRNCGADYDKISQTRIKWCWICNWQFPFRKVIFGALAVSLNPQFHGYQEPGKGVVKERGTGHYFSSMKEGLWNASILGALCRTDLHISTRIEWSERGSREGQIKWERMGNMLQKIRLLSFWEEDWGGEYGWTLRSQRGRSWGE